MSRKSQAAQTKAKIISAIMHLLSKDSFDSLKIRQICEEAGISIGSFYHYFDSKEAAMLGVSAVFDDWLQERIEKQTFTCNYDLILYICECYFLNSVYSGVNAISFVLSFQLSPNYPVSDVDRFLSIQLSQCIKNAFENGEFTSTLSVQDVTAYILCLLRGTNYDWCLAKGKFNIIKVGVEVVRRSLRSVLTFPSDKE